MNTQEGTITQAPTFNPALGPEDVEFDAPPGWHRLKELLQPALDVGGNLHTLEDVKEDIQQGKSQLWPGENCVIVTKIVVYPQKTILLYWLAGGDLEEMKRLEETIMEWARGHGAEAAVIHGRPGFEKASDGWTRQSVNLTKDL